jgi:adenine-specific DNA methylase
MTSLPARREVRKGLGAFYSPVGLVEPIIRWAVANSGDVILDPSCGDGVFLQAVARRLLTLGAPRHEAGKQLVGIDLNPGAIEVTSQGLQRVLGSRMFRLHGQDFFDVTARDLQSGDPPGVNAVIGNPPYIRYQKFAGAARGRALERSLAAGVSLPALTSSWAPFVVHAATFLSPGGRLGFILPAELVHAAYAEPVRRFLRQNFREIVLISFRQPVFPGVQEKVVILLADGYRQGIPGRLALGEVDDAADLEAIDAVISRATIYEPGREPGKWLPGFDEGPEVESLTRLSEGRSFIPLNEIGKTGIGFVSGANHYFVLTPAEARRRGLPAESLRPCVVRARQIPGAILTPADWKILRNEGDQCLLWLPFGKLKRAELMYVKEGETLGLQHRYKCRKRDPWYIVPGVACPHAFLTYMSGDVPRLCLNEARVAATNNLLAVRLHSVPAGLRKAFVVAFHNSATLLSAERTGRSYGGGVLKLEPREADRILVPSPERVRRFRGPLLNLAERLDKSLRSGPMESLRSAIAAIDEILLDRLPGGVAVPSQVLARARERLSESRRIGVRL